MDQDVFRRPPEVNYERPEDRIPHTSDDLNREALEVRGASNQQLDMGSTSDQEKPRQGRQR
ncbi:hypothetical protein JST97_17840 [bacterium]|nr:hypothetical protein [bacterium]